MKGKSYLAGLFVGATLSSLITLLTTPNSGKETRIVVKNTAQPFIHQLSEIQSHLRDLKKSLATATQEGKENIHSFVLDLKKSVTEWKDEIRPHQRHLQEEIASLEKTIAEFERHLNK
ncbi:YtxH domain-containing protein [Niallia sp. XMNu-256]|uniref:YtxH domain-containing protein n=1 Tax=Niallia sp. XMNu-256 TaxID=3082444 RepID=UPI0030CABA43